LLIKFILFFSGALCDILWSDPLRTEQAFDGKPEAACTKEELEG
jgi:hypothetical protein